MKVSFGKYKGQDWEAVPESYITWLMQENETTNTFLKKELERREFAAEANQTWVEKLIKTGYRTLMQKNHPDVGGSDADAKEINAAYESLKGKK